MKFNLNKFLLFLIEQKKYESLDYLMKIHNIRHLKHKL